MDLVNVYNFEWSLGYPDSDVKESYWYPQQTDNEQSLRRLIEIHFNKMFKEDYELHFYGDDDSHYSISSGRTIVSGHFYPALRIGKRFFKLQETFVTKVGL